MFAFMPRITSIFSDIDGTIVHYDKTLKGQGYALLAADDPASAAALAGIPNPWSLPTSVWRHEATNTAVPCFHVPSLTLGGGYISCRTLHLVDVLRSHGVAYVLMTGARTSTLLARRKSGSLPTADFDVGEGGGKIWARDGAAPDVAVAVDAAWSARFAHVTGPIEQLDDDPAVRRGPLWQCFQELRAQGYHLDCVSMSTSFLVDLGKSAVVTSKPATVEEAERALKQAFDDDYSHRFNVTYITNLGKGQVCATGCGKRTVMDYVLCLRGLVAVEAVAFFDDENDLAFAAQCGGGFLPSVAHSSVTVKLQEKQRLGEANWFRPTIDGLLGTDEGLTQVLNRVMETKKSQL